MLEFKKSELEAVLLSISAYDKDTKQLVSGLLSENLTLGTKRRLSKIHKKTHVEYLELIEDFKKLQESLKDNKEQLEKELQELLNEVVKVDAEPIQLSLLDDVSSSANYNFEIIEKFAI